MNTYIEVSQKHIKATHIEWLPYRVALTHSETYATAPRRACVLKKAVTTETLASSVTATSHSPAFRGGSGERPLLQSGPIRSAHFETPLPLTSCALELGARSCWRRRRRRRSAARQAGKEGAAKGETDSPSRRKPWWRRVAFVRMPGTKQQDFIDELTSTNADPRLSSASGTNSPLEVFFFFPFI